ncbi:MAG TPA: phosphoribosyl-AMP cyclohydrolase [Spirochaetota bacterium]|nr:phosphoribosyl-AMP cyclohydrolase [Spirochaetota bacterium]HPQ48327.1 phosphoribosyl-AMP cyclohydrolase [Spirochaetota bacterium]
MDIEKILKEINFDNLVPVIIQDKNSLRVLMLGYMNKEAFIKTLETKKVHFYSRSRKKLWLKGETSGNFLNVENIFLDCDSDTLLIIATQQGNATCHTGRVSCFFRKLEDEWKTIE